MLKNVAGTPKDSRIARIAGVLGPGPSSKVSATVLPPPGMPGAADRGPLAGSGHDDGPRAVRAARCRPARARGSGPRAPVRDGACNPNPAMATMRSGRTAAAPPTRFMTALCPTETSGASRAGTWRQRSCASPPPTAPYRGPAVGARGLRGRERLAPRRRRAMPVDGKRRGGPNERRRACRHAGARSARPAR